MNNLKEKFFSQKRIIKEIQNIPINKILSGSLGNKTRVFIPLL